MKQHISVRLTTDKEREDMNLALKLAKEKYGISRSSLIKRLVRAWVEENASKLSGE